MILEHNYNINKVVNKIGFRVGFDIKVELNDTMDVELNLKDDFILEYYKFSYSFFHFGMVYFFSKYKKGFRLEISNIKFMPIDTSHMVLTYSIIKALSEVLDFKIEGLKISDNGQFQFPK